MAKSEAISHGQQWSLVYSLETSKKFNQSQLLIMFNRYEVYFFGTKEIGKLTPDCMWPYGPKTKAKVAPKHMTKEYFPEGMEQIEKAWETQMFKADGDEHTSAEQEVVDRDVVEAEEVNAREQDGDNSIVVDKEQEEYFPGDTEQIEKGWETQIVDGDGHASAEQAVVDNDVVEAEGRSNDRDQDSYMDQVVDKEQVSAEKNILPVPEAEVVKPRRRKACGRCEKCLAPPCGVCTPCQQKYDTYPPLGL